MSRSSRSMPAIADDASAKKRRSSAVVWRAASRSTYLLLPSSAVCAMGGARARRLGTPSPPRAPRRGNARLRSAGGRGRRRLRQMHGTRRVARRLFRFVHFSRMAATDPTSSSMNAWRFPTSALCTRLPSDSRSMPTARSVSAIGVSKGAPMAAAIGADISSSSAETPWWPTRSSAAASNTRPRRGGRPRRRRDPCPPFPPRAPRQRRRRSARRARPPGCPPRGRTRSAPREALRVTFRCRQHRERLAKQPLVLRLVHAQTGLPGWRVLESAGGRHGDGGRVPSVAGGECAPTVTSGASKIGVVGLLLCMTRTTASRQTRYVRLSRFHHRDEGTRRAVRTARGAFPFLLLL